MNYLDLPKEASFTPIFSPRSSLSKIYTDMDKLTTNLSINIDKYILGFFKDAFQRSNNQLNQNQFISEGLKHLKSWQRELTYRQQKIYECLQRLFNEADNNHKGYITWNQFNSMLIQKGLNLKSLRNQQPGNTNLMKPIHNNGFTIKHNAPIEKMINIGNKIAIFSQQSSQIDFYNTDGSLSNFKSLVLSQQSLMVQTSVAKRNKGGAKQIYKKQIIVADYKNILLDMIYINDNKYNMLITSSTDFKVRGWDISSNSPVLAKQPENQDQKMEHQFPIEIHTMAWDNINEVLYCCGKEPTIYQWMIKTDSQRQLIDSDGHTDMISAMIMMPKLQFLATGGYDGKLILWDTISQTKKFKYKQHTRSISSMAFHQGLILLFTSAYDHSICVWNPYIQSLIHKIICNINIVQLDIIPDTSLLLALDSQSNVKIRQINKFSLVSSFTIQKSQHKPQQICMVTTKDPIRYYFSSSNVSVYEYVQIDANVIHDSIILCLKYNAENFMLYCPIKNHIIVWNLLTGTIATTLRNQTTSQITAFDIIKDLKISVVGDFEGNLILRKMQNGILIKKLYKHRSNITYILTYSIGSQRLIFSVSYDGQIAVFGRDANGDFNNNRTISIKKLNNLASVSCLSYQHERNILIIGTQIGQIYFLDIDKNKMISKCQTKAGDIEHFVQIEQENILLSFCKKSQIFGLYLPPHLKKYKPSCHLLNQHHTSKISSITMGKKNKRCYLGFENGDLLCFVLSIDVISDTRHQQSKSKNIIKHIWKHNFGQIVRNIILIEQQNYIVSVMGNNNIFILSCQQGEKIAELNGKISQIQLKPILYFDQDKQSIYIKQLDKSIELTDNSKEEIINRVFDPFFYLKKTQNYHMFFEKVSNKNWKFHPNLNDAISKDINRNLQIYKNVTEYEKIPRKFNIVKPQTQEPFDINKALQLHKKWEKQKEEDQNEKNLKQLNHSSYSAANLRTSKYASLAKPIIRDSKIKTIEINSQNKSPMYRLGVALRSLNQKDNKAIQLMQIAQRQHQKSKNIKFPKINAKK